MTRRSRWFYVCLGSNQGNRLGSLRAALNLLRETPRIRLGRVSDVFETSPVGYRSQRPYLNCAAGLRTDMSPMGLLVEFKRIEAGLGRRPSRRWGPRPVDLDLLGSAGMSRNTPWLKLPHPELKKRRFMLAPLAQIAPGLRMWNASGGPPSKRLRGRPVPRMFSGPTVRDLLERLKAPNQSVRIGTWDGPPRGEGGTPPRAPPRRR